MALSRLQHTAPFVAQSYSLMYCFLCTFHYSLDCDAAVLRSLPRFATLCRKALTVCQCGFALSAPLAIHCCTLGKGSSSSPIVGPCKSFDLVYSNNAANGHMLLCVIMHQQSPHRHVCLTVSTQAHSALSISQYTNIECSCLYVKVAPQDTSALSSICSLADDRTAASDYHHVMLGNVLITVHTFG